MKTNLSFREFYKRRLPHLQIEGATYFITFRLSNSLPVEALQKLSQLKQGASKLPEKQKEAAYQAWFTQFDDYLDKVLQGEPYLKNSQIATRVAQSIRFRDEKEFDLIAYCIMPNHVHLICTPLQKVDSTYFGLTEILHSLKRYTAREANKILQRSGSFWQDESYDHIIRDEAELERTMNYILYNPVKANLVKEQKDWKWAYSKYEMQSNIESYLNQ